MEDASEGFERIAIAILEMQQRTEVLLAENRHLRAELAALRQGAGILVTTLGRLYPLESGQAQSLDSLYPPR